MSDSGAHYDQMTSLFAAVLGENLHVGFFDKPDLSLHEASTLLTKQMIGQVGIKPGAKVLDIGCGVGGPARYLAEKVGCEVTGISNSQACIEKAANTAHPLVNYRCMDALALGESELGGFDIAWLLESSHLMNNKSKLFAGLYKVTTGDGKFVLCDFFLKNEEFARDRKNILKMRKIYKVFGRLDLTLPKIYQMHAQENGFKNIKITDITDSTYPTLDYWIKEAENQSEEYGGKTDFIEGVQFLQELYKNEIVSYHIISGEKP